MKCIIHCTVETYRVMLNRGPDNSPQRQPGPRRPATIPWTSRHNTLDNSPRSSCPGWGAFSDNSPHFFPLVISRSKIPHLR